MDIDRTAAPNRPGGAGLRVESVAPPPPRTRRSVRDRIVGGLILAMPLLITLWAIGWLYSILELKVIDPLVGLLLWKLRWTTSSKELPYWFETYAAPVIAIILALALLYALDLLADTRLRRTVGWALKRVPVFSHIYNPVQQIFQSLEQQPGEQRPQRMVLVTFPHPGVKLPAFVTGTCRDVETDKVVLCVYVPTTPVPTSGFFLLVPEEETTDLNWNTEQTLQAVMSGGLSTPREVSFFSGRARPNNTQAPPPAPGEAPQRPAGG
jgi:uncharacterized membrane protein